MSATLASAASLFPSAQLNKRTHRMDCVAIVCILTHTHILTFNSWFAIAVCGAEEAIEKFVCMVYMLMVYNLHSIFRSSSAEMHSVAIAKQLTGER